MSSVNIEDIAIFCKKKGFVFPSSEIYGGLAGFFDLGPLGVELMNNLKADWWTYFVKKQPDIVGIDASIISHPRIWKASGHLENFLDLALICSKCKHRVRADQFIEEQTKQVVGGMDDKVINKIVKDKKLKCPICKGTFLKVKDFNLLFKTTVGAEEEKAEVTYLRGETAQGMFTDFKLITETARLKPPFGIAQIGKCFRNEISPREFLFRSREFTIAELEFFIHPQKDKCPELVSHHDLQITLLDARTQEQGKLTKNKTTIRKMVEDKLLSEWHAFWLAEQILWFRSIGLPADKISVREHMERELSHYSSSTFDMDYEYPFGSKEIAGIADRGSFDLTQHSMESGEKLELYDEGTKARFIPKVIEPTFGMERAFLALLVSAYHNDKQSGNIVLRLPPRLSPIKIGVFPLVNKLKDSAYKIYMELLSHFPCFYDKSGSIGRRYARADEIGIPFCVTVDFDTDKDQTATIRDRNTTKQIRVKIEDLPTTLQDLTEEHRSFADLEVKK
jgi:glycyl-tRNA synthetase